MVKYMPEVIAICSKTTLPASILLKSRILFTIDNNYRQRKANTQVVLFEVWYDHFSAIETHPDY